jgi:hypothetical protein
MKPKFPEPVRKGSCVVKIYAPASQGKGFTVSYYNKGVRVRAARNDYAAERVGAGVGGDLDGPAPVVQPYPPGPTSSLSWTRLRPAPTPPTWTAPKSSGSPGNSCSPSAESIASRRCRTETVPDSLPHGSGEEQERGEAHDHGGVTRRGPR